MYCSFPVRPLYTVIDYNLVIQPFSILGNSFLVSLGEQNAKID